MSISLCYASGTTLGNILNMFLNVRDTILFCQEWGSGDPLICLHGGMGIDSSYLKVPAVLGLASDKRRVVIYDQRGHGKSERSKPENYTHEAWTRDLYELATALKIKKFALLGHSYGGFLAIEFAVRYPSLVSHLILVGTSAGPVSVKPPHMKTDDDLKDYFKEMWPCLFKSENKHWDVFERITFSRDSFNSAFQNELPKYDQRNNVKHFNIPTLLLVGDGDNYRKDMEWMSRELKQSRLEVFENTGHLPFLEEAIEFRGTVEEFLNQ